MSILEIALVILVVIWSLIFIIIAVALVLLFREIKKSLDKINSILSTGEEMAMGAKALSKVAGSSISALLSGGKKKEVIKKLIAKSSKK